MREIVSLPSKEIANKLVFYLNFNKIQAIVREGAESHTEVWIIHEKDIVPGREMANLFLKNPDSDEFQNAIKEGEIILHKKREPQITSSTILDRSKFIDAKDIFMSQPGMLTKMIGRATIGLILACLFFYLLQLLKVPFYNQQAFYISQIWGDILFPEVFRGEIWRLITPVFIHRDFFHFLFNAMWLFELGNLIETNKSSRFLLIFFFTLAIVCNIFQYLVIGPNFLGMSGVVYGLLGYVWMQIRFSSKGVYPFHSFNITFLLIWFGISLTGLVGPVANTHHGAGLCVGIIWGFLDSGYLKNNPISLKKINMENILAVLVPFSFLIIGIIADNHFFGFFHWLSFVLKNLFS